MLLNCGVGEDSWESLGLQEDPTSQSYRKSVLNIHWKDWCWSWNSSTLATWCEELIHWKRPWCWERLKAGGEGDGRGWDDWMASPTWWTRVWASSGSGWWTGKPGMLQTMRLQSWTWLNNWTKLRELAGNREGILKLSSLNYWVVYVCEASKNYAESLMCVHALFWVEDLHFYISSRGPVVPAEVRTVCLGWSSC